MTSEWSGVSIFEWGHFCNNENTLFKKIDFSNPGQHTDKRSTNIKHYMTNFGGYPLFG